MEKNLVLISTLAEIVIEMKKYFSIYKNDRAEPSITPHNQGTIQV